MTEIKFSDIFKNKEAYRFTTYENGLYKYSVSTSKYGIEKEEDLPSEILTYLYIDGVYISRIEFNKGTEMYNNLLTRNNELPVFVDISEDIPDNTYWAMENNGKIDRCHVFWYKDGKFFEFSRKAYVTYDDGYAEENDEKTFFKNLKQVAMEYLEWSNNYRDRNNIKLVQVKIEASNKTIRKIRKPKCNLKMNETYPVRDTNLVGAKYIGKVDDKYEFEIYIKENGKWVYQNIKITHTDSIIIIPNAVTYDGDVCDIDIEKTGVIVVDDQLIPISFIQGKISLYDFVKGGFREMTDNDFAELNDKEIFEINIKRIEEGGDAKWWFLSYQ